MRHAMLLMSSVIAFTGSVSEQVTYERNLQPNQPLATRVRLLSAAYRDQITRVMAHRTNQPIICLCAGQGRDQGLLSVYVAHIGAHDRGDYGAFTLKKVDGRWQILEGGTDRLFGFVFQPRKLSGA
jgi:hypothetical protein